MKQIKTIKNRLDNAELFDDAVNAAIEEGWQLTNRKVLPPMAMRNGDQTYGVLYAELEREIITEAERCCENCAHFDKDPSKEPCCSCEDAEVAPTKWEAAE